MSQRLQVERLQQSVHHLWPHVLDKLWLSVRG